MNRRSLLGALSALVVSPALAQRAPNANAPARSRESVARALSRVQPRMTQAQVRAVTGAPDDVLTRLDPELQPTTIVSELWSFGAAAHGAFPSWGSVGFDARGQVFSVHGASANLGPPGSAPIAQLPALFEKLAAVSSLNGHEFDPGTLVDAVGALAALRSEQILDVIAEYLRLAPGWMSLDTQSIFLVLRALFDPPGGQHPALALGAPDCDAAAISASGLGAFPLAIIAGVPVLLVSGYMLGGLPQQPESVLPWYRRTPLPVRRLSPTPERFASELDRTRFATLDGGNAAGTRARRTMLYEQVLRMVRDAYRPPLVRGLQHFDPAADPASRWSEMTREMTAQRVTYTPRGFINGARSSGAPQAVPARPRRLRHAYRGAGVEIEALLERRSSDVVRVWVHPTRASGPAFSGAVVTLLSSPTASAPLQRFALNNAALASYSVSDFVLAPGQSLVVRVEQQSNVAVSPALTP
ncbi:MAG: hypothetical protein U0269_29300 [Polyangiales bacterium]